MQFMAMEVLENDTITGAEKWVTERCKFPKLLTFATPRTSCPRGVFDVGCC